MNIEEVSRPSRRWRDKSRCVMLVDSLSFTGETTRSCDKMYVRVAHVDSYRRDKEFRRHSLLHPQNHNRHRDKYQANHARVRVLVRAIES